MFLYILPNGSNTFHTCPEQLNAASFQLTFCLDIITSIGPETGSVFCNDCGSRRTGKSGNIFSRFKIIADVFGFMIIRCGHDIYGNVLFFHLFPQRLHTFFYFAHYDLFSFCSFFCISSLHLSENLYLTLTQYAQPYH